MTFLEFVLIRLVGPPRGGYLPCPFRDHSNPFQVVVNEPMPGARVKARCLRECGPGPRGCFDEFDVIRATLGLSYPKQLVVLADLRREFDADPAASCPAPSTGRTDEEREARIVAQEWSDLTGRLARDGIDRDDYFAFLDDLSKLCPRYAWLGKLVEYERRFQAWAADVMARGAEEDRRAAEIEDILRRCIRRPGQPGFNGPVRRVRRCR